MLVGFLDTVPGVLHPDFQQFGIIGQLLLSLLVLYLAAFDGVRTAPPVANRYADGGEHHAERMIVIQQIMVVVACTHGNGRQILTDGHFLLQVGSLNLFAKQLILGETLNIEH